MQSSFTENLPGVTNAPGNIAEKNGQVNGAKPEVQSDSTVLNGYPDIAPMLRGELSPEDRHSLEVDSALTPEVIAATGYITVTDSAILDALNFPKSQWLSLIHI